MCHFNRNSQLWKVMQTNDPIGLPELESGKNPTPTPSVARNASPPKTADSATLILLTTFELRMSLKNPSLDLERKT